MASRALLTRPASGSACAVDSRQRVTRVASSARQCAPCARSRLQPKLIVERADDPLEREADQVAEHITRLPARNASAISGGPRGLPLRRRADQPQRCRCSSRTTPSSDHACASCAREAQAGSSSAIQDVTQSAGQSLDAETRAFFELRFGHDFSGIRVHADSRAAASAASIDSLAYTVGNHVVFAQGQFAPRTDDGRRLLAHELTHVVQQNASTALPVQRKAAPPPVSARTTTLTGTACDQDQQRKIDSGSTRAAEWLRTALAGIDAFIAGAKTKEAQTAGAALSMHFHVTDTGIASYVRTRLQTIQADLLSRANLRIECPPASDSDCAGSQDYVAVVPDANPNEINLCAPFFERSVEDDASTLVHELGHAQLGLTAKQHLIDREYKKDEYYAYMSPSEALTNAESYAMFVRQVATGSTPAPGVIPDYLRSCPDSWFPIIADAMYLARAWNHAAARSTRYTHPFSKAYKTLDTELHEGLTFKCVPDGGGRCSADVVSYWYAMGDLRICPSLIAIRSPEQRALELLASVYAVQRLIDGDAKRHDAAREARTLHAQRAPSLGDVLSGTP